MAARKKADVEVKPDEVKATEIKLEGRSKETDKKLTELLSSHRTIDPVEKVQVQLKAANPTASHTLFLQNVKIEFIDGVATVTPAMAEHLRGLGYVK